MANCQNGRLCSLEDMTGYFGLVYGEVISKQALDDRFTPEAVLFLKEVLSRLISYHFHDQLNGINQNAFNCLRLRDSTRFGLPAAYKNKYKGYGGATKSESQISIQFEFDLFSNDYIDLQLTSGCRNDQQDTQESTGNASEGNILIRDLGYITSTYLKSVIAHGAFFINRLPSQMKTYETVSGNEIDFEKAYKKMKKYNLPYLEYTVIAGKKARIPCRVIMYLNDKATYKSRMKRTSKNTGSIGCRVSERQKTRSKLDIYITNVDKEVISAYRVKQVYSLRWQIENVFKAWKSLCNIDKVKKVKIERFECMLLAGMIWILANWQIFQVINHWLIETHKKSASIWKFIKQSVQNKWIVQNILMRGKGLFQYILKLILIAKRKLSRETKKGKEPFIQSIMNIRNA